MAVTGHRREARGPESSERGAILIVLVVTITVMLLLMGRASQTWSTVTQRERETEFISRATQIADAIKRFNADQGRYPTTLKELYEPGPKGNSRYLRKKWKDPLTGGNWVLLWLAPDGASLFRSDGRPSTSGQFGAVGAGVAGSTNQASALNLSALSVPFGSPGYDADKNRSLLDTYKKSRQQRVGSHLAQGANRAFEANPEVNLGGFDTGSDLLTTPGLGPLVGVATSFSGKTYFEWKGRRDYSGYEVTVFSFQADRKGVNNPGLAPQRNLLEQPGTPLPDPRSPEGMRRLHTDPGSLQHLPDSPGRNR